MTFNSSGLRALDLYRVCQIAGRLDVSLDWLLGRSDVMEIPVVYQFEMSGNYALKTKHACGVRELALAFAI